MNILKKKEEEAGVLLWKFNRDRNFIDWTKLLVEKDYKSIETLQTFSLIYKFFFFHKSVEKIRQEILFL